MTDGFGYGKGRIGLVLGGKGGKLAF